MEPNALPVPKVDDCILLPKFDCPTPNKFSWFAWVCVHAAVEVDRNVKSFFLIQNRMSRVTEHTVLDTWWKMKIHHYSNCFCVLETKEKHSSMLKLHSIWIHKQLTLIWHITHAEICSSQCRKWCWSHVRWQFVTSGSLILFKYVTVVFQFMFSQIEILFL